MNNNEEKEIEVVNGDGTELDISPVYNHINGGKPNTNKEKKEIVIPEEKKNDKK